MTVMRLGLMCNLRKICQDSTALWRARLGLAWVSAWLTVRWVGVSSECDHVGDSRADYSAKHRRHSANVQAVTDPVGTMPWISPALPGCTHDLTAAHTHRTIRIGERRGVPVLPDRAYQGAGPWVTAALRRLPGGELTPTQRTVNRALAQGPSARRTRHGAVEVLTDLPQIPNQPQPHDRHCQSCPHPGEATLKRL